MSFSNRILDETSVLEIMYEILFFREVDLNIYFEDQIGEYEYDVIPEKVELYRNIFENIMSYFTLINLQFSYDYISEDNYANFTFDYSQVDYQFEKMDLEDKKKYGILNVFMLLIIGRAISKRSVENVYGEAMSNSKLQRVFNQITTVTGREVLTRNDLTYYLKEV